ncbi:MAG TPA: TolC family protein [Puia sp.]|jgi:outer membrane protein TolC
MQVYQLFYKKNVVAIAAALLCSGPLRAQQSMSLKDALRIAIANYGTIKAKNSYAAASRAKIVQARLDYLPNVNLGAQLDFGTANGQNGPAYAFGPAGIASSGLPLNDQSWNAAFGALYLSNINWDFFAFGRSKEKIMTAVREAARDDKDTHQEIFQHQVRVSAAYLNLLAARRLTSSYRKNLERTDTLLRVILIEARHELLAGVDSSQANAEVSNARSTLLHAMDAEDNFNNNLIKLLGISPQRLSIDTFFISRLPAAFSADGDSLDTAHPVLQYYKSRIDVSDQLAKYYRTFNYPTFSLGAAIQTRGSGFGSSYTAAQSNYTDNFYQGIKPERTNYVISLGVTWNFLQPFRTRQQVQAQRLISKGLRDELDLTEQQLRTELDLSNSKIKNALADYYETPIQVKAATDAYNQKVVLYKAGLTNLVDVTQALYALTRAETDRDISYNNVWQALLLKAAANGNFALFSSNL